MLCIRCNKPAPCISVDGMNCSGWWAVTGGWECTDCHKQREDMVMLTKPKTTCAPLFIEALNRWRGHPFAFHAGFVNGQAEKVFLGACQACMFRPIPEEYQVNLELAIDAAIRYGLQCRTVCRTKAELWLCHDDKILADLYTITENSPEWHALRAKLLGVAVVDPKFHEREGYVAPPGPTEYSGNQAVAKLAHAQRILSLFRETSPDHCLNELTALLQKGP